MISTIANVFVDSQDDIMLNLLLMYKTIIIIIIRWPIIMSYQIAPLLHLSTALHTHVQMRIKTKVYFSRPHTSAAEYTLKAARRNGMRKAKYTRAFRLLLLIGNVLKTDSKTKPT